MSERSLERTDIRIRPLLSCGAINPPTPNDLSPHFSHPATSTATPMVGAPGLSRPATITATPSHYPLDPSEGANCWPSPINQAPPLSHPAVRKATPPLFPPGISRPAIGSTTPVRGSLDCTRPYLRDDRVGVVGPHESRRFTRPATDPLSHPAMGLTTPKGTAAGCFLRDHTSHDTHIGCVPSFSPGQDCLDTHSLNAGYFLIQPRPTRHPW